MKITKKIIALSASLLLPTTAFASLVTNTFDSTDLSAWSVDRCAPEGFAVSGGELVMTVDAQSACLSQGSFYHTQGMQMNIGYSNFLSIDMFVDSSWTDQSRFGGIWGVAYDTGFTTADITDYPILEFQLPGMTSIAGDPDADFFAWDNNGWQDLVASVFNVDGWNTLAFSLDGGFINYFVNGTKVHTFATTATHIGNVILNAKNDAVGYSVRYDNLQYGTRDVPAPATFALMALALGGLVLRRNKAKV